MSETLALRADQVALGDHLLHGGHVVEVMKMGGPSRLRFKTTRGISGIFRSDSTVWVDVEERSDAAP